MELTGFFLNAVKDTPSGASPLIVTSKGELIAYPGFTANFDLAKSAALGLAALDMHTYGAAYADQCIANAQALARHLAAEGLDVDLARIRQRLDRRVVDVARSLWRSSGALRSFSFAASSSSRFVRCALVDRWRSRRRAPFGYADGRDHSPAALKWFFPNFVEFNWRS